MREAVTIWPCERVIPVVRMGVPEVVGQSFHTFHNIAVNVSADALAIITGSGRERTGADGDSLICVAWFSRADSCIRTGD
jgi:hypothetical protein